MNLLPRRRRWLQAAVFVLLSAAREVSAQPQPSPPNALVLVYRDQAISDRSLAGLVDLLAAAVPSQQWTRREVLAPGEAIESLVDRALDYFGGEGPYARPQTVQALVRAIRQGNPEIGSLRTAPLEIRLPPVPVRAHGQFRERESIRAFSAAAATYSLDQSPTTFALGRADAAPAYRLVLTEAAGELTADGQPTERARAQLTRMVERTRALEADVDFVVTGNVAAETAALARADQRTGAVRDYLASASGETVRGEVASPEPVVVREALSKQRRVAIEARFVDTHPEQVWATAATDLDRERDATTTAIVVPLDGLMRMAASGLPPGVSVLSGQMREGGDVDRVGYSRIEFLSGPVCSVDGTWLTRSEHYDSAIKRIATALSGANGSLIAARARRSPLVILDSDFTGNGHGNKVHSIVANQLRALGAEALLQHVKPVDLLLRDTPAKSNALALIDDYAASPEFVVANRPYLPEVRRWIEEDSHHVVWTGDEVHDLYLQALLWRHLRDGAFVNMSFRLLSPALRLLQPTFMQKPEASFLVVAAGNDAGTLDPVWVPQDAASAFANTINVTHGLPDGKVIGTRGGGERTNALVSLAAPGCGFVTGLVSADESGSSLAAPYVAVAAWMKSLLDGGVYGASMRRALLDAAIPIPSQDAGIESGGMFDPARLLAAPRLYVRGPRGVRALTSASLTVGCRTGEGIELRTFSAKPHLRQSLVVYASGGSHIVWYRAVRLDGFPRADLDSSCVAGSLTFTADNGAVNYGDGAAFAQEVTEFVF